MNSPSQIEGESYHYHQYQCEKVKVIFSQADILNAHDEQ